MKHARIVVTFAVLTLMGCRSSAEAPSSNALSTQEQEREVVDMGWQRLAATDMDAWEQEHADYAEALKRQSTDYCLFRLVDPVGLKETLKAKMPVPSQNPDRAGAETIGSYPMPDGTTVALSYKYRSSVPDSMAIRLNIQGYIGGGIEEATRLLHHQTTFTSVAGFSGQILGLDYIWKRGGRMVVDPAPRDQSEIYAVQLLKGPWDDSKLAGKRCQ